MVMYSCTPEGVRRVLLAVTSWQPAPMRSASHPVVYLYLAYSFMVITSLFLCAFIITLQELFVKSFFIISHTFFSRAYPAGQLGDLWVVVGGYSLQSSHHLGKFLSAHGLVVFHDSLEHLIALSLFFSLCVTLCSVLVTLCLCVEPCVLSVEVANLLTLCGVDVDNTFVVIDVHDLGPTTLIVDVIDVALGGAVCFNVVLGVELLSVDVVQFIYVVHHNNYLLCFVRCVPLFFVALLQHMGARLSRGFVKIFIDFFSLKCGKIFSNLSK